jgi:hypothetical protein
MAGVMEDLRCFAPRSTAPRFSMVAAVAPAPLPPWEADRPSPGGGRRPVRRSAAWLYAFQGGVSCHWFILHLLLSLLAYFFDWICGSLGRVVFAARPASVASFPLLSTIASSYPACSAFLTLFSLSAGSEATLVPWW